MYAIIDCNNFYASCERLFRPDLHNQPIIVLSNNDGCVIARSNEVKALGIKMGEPYFKIKLFCKKHNIHVFSSNYTLYGDLSQRVMSVIAESWPKIEIYSIDEAFLDVSTLPSPDVFCNALQKKILKYTGIPTSVGLGKTKTLAKLANYIAKKELKIPVFNITNNEHWFSQIDLDQVWGVGRQWSKRLHQFNLHTIADLKNANPQWLRQSFSVVLQRTAYELSGISCIALEEIKPRQSIQSSRSFGVMQTDYLALSHAISYHCARAFETLREQHLTTQHLFVFIQSNRFRGELSQYNPSINIRLKSPTDDLRVLTKAALFCLKKIYKTGIYYKKAGLLLSELSDKQLKQFELFHDEEDSSEKTERLMQVLDNVNLRFGRQGLHLAAQSALNSCEMKAELKSPQYTTRWSELVFVKTHTRS